MASTFRLFSFKILTLSLTILLLSLLDAVNGVPDQELQAMLTVLRSRGYNLFGNAITTSDVHYDVVAGTAFTFFAPTDSSLFALDMTANASDYIRSLRSHIVPLRVSLSDLRQLPSGSSLRTILPLRHIHLSRNQSLDSDVITVDGVEILVPGLYYSRHIAVHGLGGILSSRSPISPSPPPHSSHSTPPVSFSGSPNASSPSSDVIDNRTVLSPGPERSGIDRFSPAVSPEISTSFSPADSPGNLCSSSPGYGLLLEISPGPASALKNQPAAPSASVDECSAVPSPSIGDTYGYSDQELRFLEKTVVSLSVISENEELKPKGGLSGQIPAMMPSLRDEKDAGISPEKSLPLDVDTVDSQVTDGNDELNHVSLQPGHPHMVQRYTIYDI